MNFQVHKRSKLRHMTPPEFYIETFYEPREGFAFNQPVERLSGKKYYEYEEDSFERQHWGTIYWDSYKYNSALRDSNFNSELWKNNSVKEKAFNKIYSFIKEGKSGSGSSITPLFPFEIFLLNDGFEIKDFCELNAINPGVTILCDSFIGDKINNPKGIKYGRTYQKGKKVVNIGFGIVVKGQKTNFYFQINYENYFQVNNDIKMYKKAISGKLPKLVGEEMNIHLYMGKNQKMK